MAVNIYTHMAHNLVLVFVPNIQSDLLLLATIAQNNSMPNGTLHHIPMVVVVVVVVE